MKTAFSQPRFTDARFDGHRSFVLSSRFDDIFLLENGWFEGGGRAPDADALARISEKLIADFPDTLPLPQIVPKQDGNLLLEWQAEGGPSLDIDLANSQASFHAFDINGQDIEQDFNLEATEWPKLFAFLGEHIRAQRA